MQFVTLSKPTVAVITRLCAVHCDVTHRFDLMSITASWRMRKGDFIHVCKITSFLRLNARCIYGKCRAEFCTKLHSNRRTDVENMHSEIMYTARWGLAFSESDSCVGVCLNGQNVENERKNVIDPPKSVQLSLHRFSRNSELFGLFQWRSTPTAPHFIQICQEIWEIRLTSLSKVCY